MMNSLGRVANKKNQSSTETCRLFHIQMENVSAIDLHTRTNTFNSAIHISKLDKLLKQSNASQCLNANLQL